MVACGRRWISPAIATPSEQRRRAVFKLVRRIRRTAGATRLRFRRGSQVRWRRAWSGGAVGASGFRVGGFALDQQAAEGVQVATQEAQRQITLQPQFPAIAAAFLAVAGLQATDRRLDAGVSLLGGSEDDACSGGLSGNLLGGLLDAGLRETRRLHQLGQFVLVRGGVEATVERQLLDLIVEALLQSPRLRDGDVAIGLGAFQQAMLREKSRTVLEHQHQAAELQRLAGLATFVQLRVRLEEAEQLLVVGDLLAFDHAAMSHLTHLLSPSDERLQQREFPPFVADVLAADVLVVDVLVLVVDVLVDVVCRPRGRATLSRGEEFLRAAEHSAALLEQRDVLGLEPLLVVRSLFGGDAGGSPSHALHALQQLSVLSPATQST